MIDTKFKTKKIVVDGVNKIIPMQKKTLFGFGVWKECKDWKAVSANNEAEKVLGLNSDTTVTQIRKFIDKRDPAVLLKNDYYND